ncbi:YcxB family protein [Phormidium tenue FACHB-886]|nr:YcxB family protein [Phormidium tenue FACHB-886]
MAALLLPLDINIFRQLSVWLAWKKSSNRHTQKALELSSTGYTLTGQNSHSAVEWSNYSCVIETRNLFMLYESRSCPFQVFPKRAFGSFEELERFRRLVRSAGLEIVPR